ncbi:MAG: hypothetical protein AAF824_16355, partial [Bacteroidota bacterium]
HVLDPQDSHPPQGDVPPAIRSLEPVDSHPPQGDVPPATRSLEPVDSHPPQGDVPPATRSLEPVDSHPPQGDVPPATRSLEPVDSHPPQGDVPPATRSLEPVDSHPPQGDVPPATRSLEPVDSHPPQGDVPPATRSLSRSGLGIEPPTTPDSASVSVLRGTDWQVFQGSNGNPPPSISTQNLSVAFPGFANQQSKRKDKVYALISFKKIFKQGHYLVVGYNNIQNPQNELILSRVTEKWEEVRWRPLITSGAKAEFRDTIIVNIQGRDQLLLEFWATEREKEKVEFLLEVVSKFELTNSPTFRAMRHDHILGSVDIK